jgi:hypothetical protein
MVWLDRGLLMLTLMLLSYSLVGALNARASFNWDQFRLEYRDCINGLPHSYDAPASLFAFWQYLAWACVFWATKDWLSIKTKAEMIREASEEGSRFPVLYSERLGRLMWVVAINGAILAVVSILQRLDGTPKLLWLRERHWKTKADQSFGPYGYRSNAAQYLNLVWPLALAFWQMCRQSYRLQNPQQHRTGQGRYVVLLPSVAVMIIASVMSLSRGGALFAVLGAFISLCLLYAHTHSRHKWQIAGVGAVLMTIVGVGLYLDSGNLEKRLKMDLNKDVSSIARWLAYQDAYRMFQDYPAYGIGPMAFNSMSQLYNSNEQGFGMATVHNDWLQTLAEWGAIGSVLVLLALILAIGYSMIAHLGHRLLTQSLLLSVLMILTHAAMDFPLQIYSIAVTFVLFLAAGASLPPRRLAYARPFRSSEGKSHMGGRSHEANVQ